jgi:hypothetical protein
MERARCNHIHLTATCFTSLNPISDVVAAAEVNSSCRNRVLLVDVITNQVKGTIVIESPPQLRISCDVLHAC